MTVWISALAIALALALVGSALIYWSKFLNDVSAHGVSKKSGYRAEIDGVRALAVISVIINHFDKNLLPSGYLGVDIFFVISGYVISSSLYNGSTKNFADFILGFYSRRVKRLVPGLILCVLLTSVLICLFDPNPRVSFRTGGASLFGLSNLYLLKQATDYFGASAQLNAFTHTWSLGVEEQFYAFFPLIFWFTGFTRRHSKGLRNLVCVLGFLAFWSLALFVRKSILQSPGAFFLMPARFWELSAGSLVFVALDSEQRFVVPLVRMVRSLIVLVSLAGALFAPARYSVFTTIVVVLLTALLIASLRPQTLGYEILAHPTAVYIGSISYSLYLWHWSILVISRWTIGIRWWSAPLQAGLMLFLAATSYRYVESPMRHAGWPPNRWKSILYGIAASACAAGLIVILAKPLGRRLYTGRAPKLAAVGTQSLLDNYVVPDKSSSWRGKECVLSDNAQVGKIIPIDGCTLGDFSSAKHRVLVMGNSFSTAFVQAFDELVMSDRYSVTITSAWGASPVAEIPNSGPWEKADNYYWGEVSPSLLSDLRIGDSVFLITDIAIFLPESASNVSEQNFLRQLSAGLAKLSQRLSERGIRLVVLDGLPFAREAECEPAVAKQQWFTPFNGPCHFISKQQTLRRRAELDEMLASLRNQRKITVVDLIEVFCPGKVCTYDSSDGQMLYRDAWSHPSVEAARLSAPIIRNVLTSDDR
jgi:peptidoglycan/LPS O-acetylase OafA/YrhL